MFVLKPKGGWANHLWKTGWTPSGPKLASFITNELDGTEDDIFWEEMDESEPFADDDGMESTVVKEGDLFNAMLKMWKWMNKNTTTFLVKKTLMKVISMDFN